MTPAEIDTLLNQVADRTERPRAAMAKLIAAGWSLVEAEEAVFTALGGSDLVEIDATGREIYSPSGKLVADIESELKAR